MDAIDILLLDFSSEEGLSASLKSALDSSPSLRVHYSRQSLSEWVFSRPEKTYTRMRAQSTADMALFILPANLLQECERVLAFLRAESSRVPILVLLDDSNVSYTTTVMLKFGTIDFISEPLTPANALPAVWKLLDQRCHDRMPMHLLEQLHSSRQIVGRSLPFLEEIRKVPIVASCDSSVLVYGETGTGKEIITQRIHELSARADQPFIPVNCGAIPVDLVENELFGHKCGAYTSASDSRAGLISEAEGGTLFLDEVDSLPQMAQVKLLRFVQDKTYRPLGSPKERTADVRVIAAASRDPAEAVREGRLRRDLYYRLNVVSLAIPPLRERREDIPLLAHHFLVKYSKQNGKSVAVLGESAIEKLLYHDWPGNVRELEHVTERAVVMCNRSVIAAEDISLPEEGTAGEVNSFRQAKEWHVQQFEKTYITKLLFMYHGNISKAARAAKKNRRAFWELIRKHGIETGKFKQTQQETIPSVQDV